MAPTDAAQRETDTLVVGAGPAGLAVAACLGLARVPCVVLERHDVVASAWHQHYERLHLHTVKKHSGLPHRPMPAHYPRYPSRQQVVDYLTDYAEHFGVRPRFGVTVAAVRRGLRGWEVDTDEGLWRATRVVFATGYNGVPKIPSWPGLDAFAGEVLHSSRYKSGAPYKGQRVLVVGIGNSGAEIALDLWEHGASPTLCVRSPVHVLPRDLLGIPAQHTGLALSKLPPKLADALALPLIKAAVGDLRPYGIRRPRLGPAEQVVTLGRIPLLDVGTIGLVKQGEIGVVGDIRAFTDAGVELVDGARHPFDAVVLATGYVPALERFLDADVHARVTDERGYPRAHGTESPVPGLFFLGFRNPLTGQLRDIRLEAERVAGEIAAGAGRADRG